MVNRMHRRALMLGTVALLVSTGLLASHVGLAWGARNTATAGLQSLRQAVANADDGDVIRIAPGVYQGVNLVITKNITLEGAGEDRGDVVLIGRANRTEDAVIEIRGANVRIANLTVKARGSDRAINIMHRGDNIRSEVEIDNCQASGGRHAVIRTHKSRSTITGCLIEGGVPEGLNYSFSTGKVEFCDIHRNHTNGIRVEQPSSRVTIADCTIHRQGGAPVVAENNQETVVSDCVLDGSRLSRAN